MENRFAIPVLLCAAAIAFACGPWRQHDNATSASATQKTSKRSQKVATVFNVTPANEGNDTAVRFALRILNNTDKTVELRFPSGQTHDFVVLDSLGRTVWRWSEGRMFTQAMQSKAVKASDTMTIENQWDARNAHGQYVAVATLNTTTNPVERRIPFTLP